MEKDDALIVTDGADTKALKEAMSFVIGKRLPIPKNWAGTELDKLEFPSDLSAVNTYELGNLMGVWSTVMAYTQYETARIDVEKTAKGNRYEFMKKKTYLELLYDETIVMSEEQRKAEVHVRTAKMLNEYEIAKAKYTLAVALLGVYSKYYQALSRELSRRGLDGSETAPKYNNDDEFDLSEDIENSREALTKDWSRNQLEVSNG